MLRNYIQSTDIKIIENMQRHVEYSTMRPGIVTLLMGRTIFWCGAAGLLPGGLLDGPTPKQKVFLC